MFHFNNNFEAAFYIAIAVWFVALPLGIVLIYFSIQGFKNAETIGGKWGATIPVVIALPLLIAGITGLSMTIGDFPIWNKIRTERHSWVLKDSTEIEGVIFPTQTKIYFSRFFKMKHKRQARLEDIDKVELSDSIQFLRYPVEAIIEGDPFEYKITLSENVNIDGFPISKGRAIISRDGTFKCGMTYKNHDLQGIDIPQGSEIKYPLLDVDKGIYQVYLKGKDQAYRIDTNTNEIIDIGSGSREL